MKKAEGKAVIGEVRFCYVHVWEKQNISGKEGDEKYSCCCMFTKNEKKIIEQIKQAIKEALKRGARQYGEKWLKQATENKENIVKDGNEKFPDNPEFADMYFINAYAKTAPGVVDRKRQPILDKDEFYSGCYGYVSITIYPFNNPTNKGISVGLNHVMKTKDGEFLGGRSSAEDDFSDIDLGDEDDDLSDLF